MRDMREMEAMGQERRDGAGDAAASLGELCSRTEVGIPTLAEYLSQAQPGAAGGGGGAQKVVEQALKEIERIRLRCVCDGDCWIWSGSHNSKGLPSINRMVDGELRTISARRWVLMSKGEQLGARDVVTTTCGDISCLNPKHLKKTTRGAVQKNSNRKDPGLKAKRGRSIKAAWMRKGQGWKLNDEQAAYARNPEIPSKQVAQELGISVSMVNYIRRGVAWRDLCSPFSGLGAKA